MQLDTKMMKKLALLIAFGIVLFLGLNHIGLIIGSLAWVVRLFFPFVLGLCIAFILNIPMRFLERILFSNANTEKKWVRNIRRPASLILTLLLVLGLIVVVLVLIIPELARTLMSLANRIPDALITGQVWLNNLTERYPILTEWAKTIQIDWSNIGQKTISFFQNSAGTLLDSTFVAVTNMVSGLFNFFLAFIFAMYILIQKEKLGFQVKKLLYAYFPQQKVNHAIYFGKLSSKTFSSFLSCQCFEATLLGTIFFVAMSIFGFPYAVLISVLIGFTALIPIFGAVIGCVIGALLILVVSPIRALWFIIMFIILQQLEGNLIYPHVVGNSVGLPSILVLVAVTVGGNLMGIPGMLIFLPLCSVLYALLGENVNKRLKSSGINIPDSGEDSDSDIPSGPKPAGTLDKRLGRGLGQTISNIFSKFSRKNETHFDANSEDTDLDTSTPETESDHHETEDL